MTRRKRMLWITTLLIGLAVIAFWAAPALAQGDQGFTETFDDAQLPGWEHAPEAIVADGVLRIGPAQFAARLGAWQDFTLRFELRYSGEGETHVNYRATDQGSYLLLLRPGEATLLKTAPPGEPQELGSARAEALNTTDWVTVQIALSGGNHTIMVNDEAVISANDPDPLGRGGLIFGSVGQRTTELDNLNMQPGGASVEPAPIEPGGPLTAPTAAPPVQTPAAGSWQDLLRSLSTSQGSTFETDVFVINLLLAVLTSFILSRVYIYWGSSLSNRRKFAANFILVTVTTTFIILVVRSSVALSLGLVGALSIIRFRAAIKEPEELAYLFFAISLGIGLGDNQRVVTLITLVVVVIVIGLARLLRQTQADVNLHLTVSSHGGEKVTLQQLLDVLARHTSKLRLLRFDETPEALEISFVVEFRHISNLEQARMALLELSPGLQVSFLDNKGVW
ncbi:MAG: DUF4956 domain-containing protein [Anaerolineales bacterium]|nr:DUF4956 domain-containing protein [Anaerolineales bacterium]